MLQKLLSVPAAEMQVDKASIKSYLLPLLRDNSPHSILLMDVISKFATRKDCVDVILVAAARFAESSKLSSKQGKKLLQLLTLLESSSENVEFFVRSPLLHRIFALGKLDDISIYLSLFSFIQLLVEHRTSRVAGCSLDLPLRFLFLEQFVSLAQKAVSLCPLENELACIVQKLLYALCVDGRRTILSNTQKRLVFA